MKSSTFPLIALVALSVAGISELAVQLNSVQASGMKADFECFLFSQPLPGPCGCPINNNAYDWCSGQLPTADPANDHQIIYLPGCMSYPFSNCDESPPSGDCTGGANSCGDKIYLCNIKCDGTSTSVPPSGIQCQLTTKPAGGL